MKTNSQIGLGIGLTAAAVCSCGRPAALEIKKIDGAKPMNVVFILSDDHRYDYMGFTGAVPWLQTPAMDFMAANGAYVQNAFVTTSLSSPSRASILTGMFSHEHTVVDNVAKVPEGLTYFPQYLQEAGYTTGFFGKWHMGDSGWEQQPGFDHWESFKGQGTYYNVKMNVNGEVREYGPDRYVADILTEDAIDFIDRNKEKPFFVYLSHKNVHQPFGTDKDCQGMYAGKEVPKPASFYNPVYGVHELPSLDENGKAASGRDWYGKDRKPDWVKHQRESWHGVDYIYNGMDYERECRRYCECVTNLDHSIQEVLDYLKAEGLDKNTMVIYMGDNGFSWGEHGLIDKRTFYESSVRVPMLVYCPGVIEPGTVVKEMVQNIDIAPTVMEVCGLEKADQMRGSSFYPLLQGKTVPDWRKQIFYEYYWEHSYPQTPTTFGVRSDRYKYIKYHGIWDTNEFYDLENDPDELHNLIDSPEHQEIIKEMANELYDWLQETGGMNIPLKRDTAPKIDHRNKRTR